MEIYYDIDGFTPSQERSSVALGYFDGVHMGHRAVIESCVRSGGDPVVLTFAQSPAAALGRDVPPALTDNARKAGLMEDIGVSAVIFADFARIKDMSAEAFVKDILSGRLRAKTVCCGYNYRFGRGGSGDTALLAELCAREGIGVNIAEPVYIGGSAVSSTAIRAMLESGDVSSANRLLGYRYSVTGAVGSGNHFGRALGFPTVNLPISEGLCVPAFGVYESRVIVGGREYIGATNIGVHPTVGASEAPLCESFILDYEGRGLYGDEIVCELVRSIRPEMRFASVDELSEQIEKDVIQIRNMK